MFLAKKKNSYSGADLTKLYLCTCKLAIRQSIEAEINKRLVSSFVVSHAFWTIIKTALPK